MDLFPYQNGSLALRNNRGVIACGK
jgi:hypothetical protein